MQLLLGDWSLMKNLKLVLPALILSGGFLVCTTVSYSKPDYTKKEKKACTFCHNAATAKDANAKDLTDAGKYYQEHKSLDGYKK